MEKPCLFTLRYWLIVCVFIFYEKRVIKFLNLQHGRTPLQYVTKLITDTVYSCIQSMYSKNEMIFYSKIEMVLIFKHTHF